MVLATLAGSVSAGSVAYTYDTLGRLTKATYANRIVIAYAYDATGNRSSAVVTGAPAAATAVPTAASATPTTRTTAAPAATASASDRPPEDAPSGPVPLPATGEDPAVYGWNDRSDRPENALTVVFEGDGSDRLLHLQGYAIEAPDTVGLWLNGTLLGYLSPAGDGLWSTPSLWLLPASLQVPGENLVALVPRTAGLVWGVARLGLYPFGSAWGNQDGLPGGDLTHPEGLELHLPNHSAGYLIALAGWDADKDAEIAIERNGTPLVGLPPSGERAWGATYHLWLGPELLAAGDNRLAIADRFGPLEPWGVRIERVLPGDTALGEGLPGQAAAEERRGGVRLLLPPSNQVTELDLAYFDLDFSDELAVMLDGLSQGHAPLTGNNAWGIPQAVLLPLGLPAVLSIAPTGNAPTADAWGVRIEGWR